MQAVLHMLKKLKFFLFFLSIAGCVEPYEFVVHDPFPSLVVEAYISDKSFNETRTYPSDGRYFTVKLSLTGHVTNIRPVPVTGAIIELLTGGGNALVYNEGDAGVYSLFDDEFKAVIGEEYKLRITLEDENVYESTWETLPEAVVPPMGEIGFTESEQQMYVMESSEWVIRTIEGVTTSIRVPENSTDGTILYRWTYSPTWIYKAPLSSVIDAGNICWATDVNYLNTYGLQRDRSGGYTKDLFFFRTIRNERIFEKFSVLVTQHAMTDPYYNFWKEMKDQNEGGTMSDVPPYNLRTNFFSTTGDKHVSGFFGVVSEQAKRWYFTRNDLSYNVVNTLRADCLVDYGGPPAAECFDCRAYSFGKATTTRPLWWPR